MSNVARSGVVCFCVLQFLAVCAFVAETGHALVECKWDDIYQADLGPIDDVRRECTPPDQDCTVYIETDSCINWDTSGSGGNCWCNINGQVNFSESDEECDCNIGYTTDPSLREIDGWGDGVSSLSVAGMQFSCPQFVFFAIVANCPGGSGNCVLYSKENFCGNGCPPP